MMFLLMIVLIKNDVVIGDNIDMRMMLLLMIMFDAYSASISYHLVNVPPVFVLGVIGGILGSLFNLILSKVLRIYNFINE